MVSKLTACDFSVLTSLPARISGKNAGDIPYFEGGGEIPHARRESAKGGES